MNRFACYSSELKDGYIIAEDVYSESGTVLVLEDTEVNGFIKEKLLNFGIDRIHVYESAPVSYEQSYRAEVAEFEKHYVSYVSTVKETVNDLASGKGIDFEKVNYISDSMYRQVNNNYVVIECVNQLKMADQYTYTHCLNVSLYALLLGKWLNLGETLLHDLILSGILHDIGKARIPSYILNKVEPLLDREFEVIKKHPILGYEIIKDIPQIDGRVKEAVLTHHEKLNGEGYPFGLRENRLGLYARIISIADVYDAITSDRVYRPKSTPFEAFKEFERIGLGTGWFDPAILLCFFSNIARYYTGSTVKMSDGRTGKVVYVPPHNISSPVVRIGDEYLDLSRDNTVKIEELI